MCVFRGLRGVLVTVTYSCKRTGEKSGCGQGSGSTPVWVGGEYPLKNLSYQDSDKKHWRMKNNRKHTCSKVKLKNIPSSGYWRFPYK